MHELMHRHPLYLATSQDQFKRLQLHVIPEMRNEHLIRCATFYTTLLSHFKRVKQLAQTTFCQSTLFSDSQLLNQLAQTTLSHRASLV